MSEMTLMTDERPTRSFLEKYIPAALMLLLLLLLFRPLFAWDLKTLSEARHPAEFTQTYGPLPPLQPGQMMTGQARENFFWDLVTFMIVASVVVWVSSGRMRMIVYNTFREAVRNRILYFIVLFALILIGASMVLKDLAVANPRRIVINLGLASINFFGLLVAVFVGISLVYNELERKTIYTIVSKPIHRYQYLLGKFFGLLLTIYIILAIMTWFFYAVLNFQYLAHEDALLDFMGYMRGGEGRPNWHALLFYGGKIIQSGVSACLNILGFPTDSGLFQSLGIASHAVTGRFLVATGSICLELMIVTAFAILFSSFTTPTLSAVFTVLIFLAGRLNEDIIRLSIKMASDAAAAFPDATSLSDFPTGVVIKIYFVRFVSWMVPNLGSLNINEKILHSDVMRLWRYPAVYALCYTGAILMLSILIFRRRNFK